MTTVFIHEKRYVFKTGNKLRINFSPNLFSLMHCESTNSECKLIETEKTTDKTSQARLDQRH